MERPPRSVRVVGDWRLASHIVSSVMGEYHGYYAGWAAEHCGGGLVALAEGRPAGSVVYYTVETPHARIGVVYYVAVLPRYRGLGLGRILVASAEEVMRGSDVYVATTSESNVASRRLFHSMGYRVESWISLERRLGPAPREVLEMAACAYEDDVVMYKEVAPGALSRIGAGDLRAARNAWDGVCLKPYLLRKRQARRRLKLTAWPPA